MLKLINKIGTQPRAVSEGKHPKFKVASHPALPFKDEIIIRVDTGADVKCMNENTFKALFPEVKLTCCPYEIQNFGNSIADIQIFGQFGAYLLFKGRKYEHTFIVLRFLYFFFGRNKSSSCFFKETFFDKQRVVFAIVSSLLQWNLYVLPCN